MQFFRMMWMMAGVLVAKEAPYGTWESPITAEMIAEGGVRLNGVSEENGAIYIGERRPMEKGRNAIIRIQGGRVEEMIPMPYNARTRVYEYGGKSTVMVGDVLYFSNFQDQQIYRRDKDGTITQLTDVKEARFADGSYAGGWIYYVLEIGQENFIGAVDVKTGKMMRVVEGADFYAYPRVSEDGKRLAYYCWNDPNMPWDGGELRVAELKSDGTVASEKLVEKGSICQISWGPDGALYYVSERTGWWNLYRDGMPLCQMNAEFGEPLWLLGTTTFDFWGKDKIISVYTQKGMDYVGVIQDGKLKTISLPYTAIHSPSVTGDYLYFVGSAGDKPAVAVQYNLKTGEQKVLRKSRELTIDPAYISIPQSIEFPTTNGKTAHAFYYAPKNPNYKGMAGELPPMVVSAHGGPTAAATTMFTPEIQYYTSRGIAYLDVNYGGSTGYGREYRNRLVDAWGVVDVDDCMNAALYCCKKGWADQNRLGITGGSAGGFTTLASLAFRDGTYRVGSSLYGVSDLEAMATHMHKFEARYLDSLVGPYPAMKDLYIERSPVRHADQIKVPAIFLQGDEDAIVPPSQSEVMYNSLLKREVPTAYLLFENEQHGFRQAKNIQRSIEAEAYFFSKVMGFTLADKITPVKIENLTKE